MLTLLKVGLRLSVKSLQSAGGNLQEELVIGAECFGGQRLKSLLSSMPACFRTWSFSSPILSPGEFRFDPGIIGLQLGQCILECVVLLGSLRQFRFQCLTL